MQPIVDKINQLEVTYQSLDEASLILKTQEFRSRVEKGESLDDILPEAFAVVKNVCRRFTDSAREIDVRGQKIRWEMIPYNVQLVGGIVLHRGGISEMATGEGKTLVATLPTYLNALAGKGVHVVTVNDYLAARDSEWMGEIYRFLGLTVGCLQHGQNPTQRRREYACDITYGTNSEYGFDYLRDNGMATTLEEQVQRGHFFAIVDEVDSILIDEARVPLIISGPSTVSTHQYDRFKDKIASLVRRQESQCNDFVKEAKELIEKKGRTKDDLAAAGRLLFKCKMGLPRQSDLLRYMEDPEIRRAIDDAELALYQDTRRTELYRLKEELLYSIDEKSNESDLSEKGREFLSPNNPDSFVMPDLITIHHDIDQEANLTPELKHQKKEKAREMYEETSQRLHNISQLLRAFCCYEKDVHYVVEDNKVVIVDEFTGRPMPGRRWSDGLHQAVEAKECVKIDRESQTMATITIQNYFRLYEKLSGMTGTAETEANEFRDIYGLIVTVIPQNRPNQRKDQDDTIFKTRREKFIALIDEVKKRHGTGQPILVGTVAVESSEVISKMLKKVNIPHNVLNAKYHQQEAEIIARAGQRGAVTIATNMAGRGTDIKLGAGVADIGGLCVIGTERHESRRIDRQLRGRCARQGDPGESLFFVSFEDDLMRNFGDSRRMTNLMTTMGMQEGEGISHWSLTATVENAQRRVEQRNYQIRKHTLQYDDVMNQQRTVIYNYRSDILHTTSPREDIFQVVDEVLRQECVRFLDEDKKDVDGLIKWLNHAMPLSLMRDGFDWDKDSETIADALIQKVKETYELKITFENPDAIVSLERYIILAAIDKLWQEHLFSMDGLRQSISLRSYAQKDPLIEYKQEAYKMFEELMRQIKREVVQNLFRSATTLQAFEMFLKDLPQRAGTGALPPGIAPVSSTQESLPAEQSALPPKEETLHLPTIRAVHKFGRNDTVKVTKGSETQSVKYKKAQQMEMEGWKIVGKG